MRTAAFSVAVLIAPVLTAACSPSLAKGRASLLAADRAFAEATDARGVDGWMSYFAADAVSMPDGGPIVQDTARVRADIAALLRDPAMKLRWAPERAELAESRDLGYTYGYWRLMRLAGNADSQVVARGKYVTIWRRAPSGDWKVVLDIGNGVRD
jgi:ketosteroid isomerase-like protein